MIAQLALDDNTLISLLGDPRMWKIVPGLQNRYTEWTKAAEAPADCPPCQRTGYEEQRNRILNQFRTSLLGLPNAQRIQLKQLLSAQKILIFIASGGRVDKHYL